VRKISPPTGIQFPDRPARSQSLYRLSCCGPLLNKRTFQINTMHTVIRKFQHCKFQSPSEVTAILCSHSLNLFKICINIMFSSMSWSSHCLFSKSFLQKRLNYSSRGACSFHCIILHSPRSRGTQDARTNDKLLLYKPIISPIPSPFKLGNAQYSSLYFVSTHFHCNSLRSKTPSEACTVHSKGINRFDVRRSVHHHTIQIN
jgi:hypothetical protein